MVAILTNEGILINFGKANRFQKSFKCFQSLMRASIPSNNFRVRLAMNESLVAKSSNNFWFWYLKHKLIKSFWHLYF